MSIEVKKYEFSFAGSNMYIIICDDEALVIDPNVSEEALDYLKSNGICRLTILLTHEHYDHTSGLTWLCGKYESVVICHEETALSLSKGKNSRPVIIASNRMDKLTPEEIKAIVHTLPHNYSYSADIVFTDDYCFNWKNHVIRMIACPGHSRGSCCIEIDDLIVATGDSLIPNTPVLTRLPGGNPEAYAKITLPYLKKIKDTVLILPGHGDILYMEEIKAQLTY